MATSKKTSKKAAKKTAKKTAKPAKPAAKKKAAPAAKKKSPSSKPAVKKTAKSAPTASTKKTASSARKSALDPIQELGKDWIKVVQDSSLEQSLQRIQKSLKQNLDVESLIFAGLLDKEYRVLFACSGNQSWIASSRQAGPNLPDDLLQPAGAFKCNQTPEVSDGLSFQETDALHALTLPVPETVNSPEGHLIVFRTATNFVKSDLDSLRIFQSFFLAEYRQMATLETSKELKSVTGNLQSAEKSREKAQQDLEKVRNDLQAKAESLQSDKGNLLSEIENLKAEHDRTLEQSLAEQKESLVQSHAQEIQTRDDEFSSRLEKEKERGVRQTQNSRAGRHLV